VTAAAAAAASCGRLPSFAAIRANSTCAHYHCHASVEGQNMQPKCKPWQHTHRWEPAEQLQLAVCAALLLQALSISGNAQLTKAGLLAVR
jgi:hypothetical protein